MDVFPLSKLSRQADAGSKSRQLTFLAKKGYKVPNTHIVSPALFDLHLEDPAAARDKLRVGLKPIVAKKKKYAVRSSANVEDTADHSFAGQFETCLDVQGLEPIIKAVEIVWASARSERLTAYLRHNEMCVDDISMGVLVQEMVQPSFSGVAFSRNPMTGLREVVVEAVKGRGDTYVQGGRTPDRWVNKWGTYLETSETSELDRKVVDDLVAQTRTLEKDFGRPVDLEWVYDGSKINWVQLREITGLDAINIYSNRLSREHLPGAIKPLIWSINIPLVNTAWVKLISEAIGPNDLDPLQLAKSFYYRAYFNMGVLGRMLELMGLPADTLELLLGLEIEGDGKPKFRPSAKTYSLAPRIIAFACGKLALERKIKRILTKSKEDYKPFADDSLDGMTDQRLIEQLDKLFELNLELAYFNVITPILSQAYTAGLRGQLKKRDLDLDTVDLDALAPRMGNHDPNKSLDHLAQIYASLSAEEKARIDRDGIDVLTSLTSSEGQSFAGSFQSFLEAFGHFSDSGNDFSVSPWREQPDLILQMVLGRNPDTTVRTRTPIGDVASSGGTTRLMWFAKRAAKYQVYREAISSTYTYGYGLFRRYALELERRLVRHDIIEHAEDIYFLELGEVRSLIAGATMTHNPKDTVSKRRAEMDSLQNVDSRLPTTIYGDDTPLLIEPTDDTLRGVATSRGTYQGPARVVRGITDFDKVQKGDVIIIPYSDVGWSPIFAKAGAIVSESGGILSHSSIVAREYGIPAIVSVPGACAVFKDGEVVVVDGLQGLVQRVTHNSEAA